MLADFASAVLARLRSDSNLLVFDGGNEVPDRQTPPYVVAYVSVDGETSERMTVNTSSARVRVTTHCVADTSAGARIVVGRVRSLLLDWRYSPQSSPVRHEYGLPPSLDESTGYPVLDAVDGWAATVQMEA